MEAKLGSICKLKSGNSDFSYTISINSTKNEGKSGIAVPIYVFGVVPWASFHLGNLRDVYNMQYFPIIGNCILLNHINFTKWK